MSYPYMEVDGIRLSLIAPFTIDDILIKEIDTRTIIYADRPEHYGVTIEIVAINLARISFRYDSSYVEYLCRKMKNEYKTFLQRNCRSICLNANANPIYEYDNDQDYYIGQECLHMLNDNEYTNIFEHLITDIGAQCSKLRRCGTRDFDISLYRQGRPIRYAECENSSERVYVSSTPISSTNTTNANGRTYRYLDEDSLTRLTNAISSSFNNGSNYISSAFVAEQIIHSHYYTPKYKKHFIAEENESTALLLGAEIEVDCGGKSETHAKEVLKIMNGEDAWNSEENIYCVHDGSLANGLEFPTQPGTLAWHRTLPYEKMFKYLDDNGYKAHDTQTCGLHVHINRSFFGDKESECIGKLMYIIEKFNDKFSILGRRDCRYSKLLGYNGEKCKELYQKGYQNRDKYNAINLLHTDTIEIRAFKGTLKYSTFINTLEFVSDLAHFVKNRTEDEIENMQWADLYTTFSDELKKYYDSREKIESEKVKDKTSGDATSVGRTIRSILNINPVAFTVGNSTFHLPPITNPTLSINSEDCDPVEFDRIIDALNNTSCNLQLISEAFDNNISQSITKEAELKNLKKQLKTEQNYIAKISLNRRINKLQKEIKKEKKRNGQSS